MRLLIPFALAVLLASCTTVPEPIKGTFPVLAPGSVVSSAIGSQVRWGGVILGTSNLGDRTCFEVLSRELDTYLRPSNEDYSDGRFIACKEGFQDPVVFSKGREITITGVIRSIRSGQVEEFSYRFPLVEVDNLVLWEKRRQVVVYRGFHDPWMYRYPWHHPWMGYRPIGGSWGQAEATTTLPGPSIVNGKDGDPE